MAKDNEHFETPDKRGTAIKQGAKNKEPEMTMEEYLLSQLDTPVVLKDGTMMTKPDGSPMTKHILNLAMKGDVKAAQYIQNIQMRAKIMKIRAPFTQGGGLRRGCGIAA